MLVADGDGGNDGGVAWCDAGLMVWLDGEEDCDACVLLMVVTVVMVWCLWCCAVA